MVQQVLDLVCRTRDEHGQDWIGLDQADANFDRIRTVSDCNLFENWRITTGSD